MSSIGPVIILVLCSLMMSSIAIVTLFKYIELQRYENSVRGAWGTHMLEETRQSLKVSSDLLVAPIGNSFSVHNMISCAHHIAHIMSPESENGQKIFFSSTTEKEIVRIYKYKFEKCTVVAFRGTVTQEEVTQDMDTEQVKWIGGSMVHRGFHNMYAKIKDQIIPTIVEDSKQGNTIFITGYSLGGALATLLSFELKNHYRVSSVCIAIASPKVGNEVFAQKFEAAGVRLMRVSNAVDIICSLPLPAMPNFNDPHGPLHVYIHVGQSTEFVDHRGNWNKNHHLSTYIENMELF